MTVFSLQQFKARLEWYKRRVVFGLVGLILLKIGAGFLLAAIWMIIAAEFSPLIATLVCAALFFGAGLIVLAVRGARPKPELPSLETRTRPSARAARKERKSTEYPALLEALLFGLSTYQQVRKERR